MTYGDFAWRTSRLLAWRRCAIFATRGRGYGLDRIPLEGGCVLAINHLDWIDVPLVGGLSPRNLNYVAKVEAHRAPGLGQLIRWHGTLAVRRGESDRDAVRLMRAGGARRPRARRSSSRGRASAAACPARRSRARRWSRSRRACRSSRSAIYGTQFWKLGNFAPCSIAVGEPFLLDGLPKGGARLQGGARTRSSGGSACSSTGSPTCTRAAARRRGAADRRADGRAREAGA